MIPIIISLLDTDFYKLTMQQAVLELFPDTVVTYRFKNRGDQRFTPSFLIELQNQIVAMSTIKLFPEEYSWIQKEIPFFKPAYLEYLKNYRFKPEEVKISLDEDYNLIINIVGPWHSTILWEVPLMALISELYFKMVDIDWKPNYDGEYKAFPNWKWQQNSQNLKWDMTSQREKAFVKWNMMRKAGALYADFGTRRRRSKDAQECVIKAFVDAQKQYSIIYPSAKNLPFVGTSNVYFAMKYAIKYIGTKAHEWYMAISVLEGLRNANYYALQNWVRVYNADLGIALTDTFGSDAFFRNFNLRLAKLYDGIRHDSGDAFVFTDKAIAHYEKLGIDPASKNIVFSDGLNIDMAIKVKKYCEGKIKCAFGIGTHLTNDFEESKALNMVIKLWSCEDVPVVKLSDAPGKVMGDPDAVKIAQWMFPL